LIKNKHVGIPIATSTHNHPHPSASNTEPRSKPLSSQPSQHAQAAEIERYGKQTHQPTERGEAAYSHRPKAHPRFGTVSAGSIAICTTTATVGAVIPALGRFPFMRIIRTTFFFFDKRVNQLSRGGGGWPFPV
jgi:hypothetical protein